MKATTNRNQVNLIYSTQESIKFEKKGHSHSIDKTKLKVPITPKIEISILSSYLLQKDKNIKNLITQIERPQTSTAKSSKANSPL